MSTIAVTRPTTRPPMRPARRAAQLVLGLAAYAWSMAMLLHAGQGAMPWDVLHQGIVRTTGWSFGVVVALTSVVVLAAWVPLRQRPGVGTVANVVIISVCVGPSLVAVRALVPDPGTGAAVLLAAGGIVLNGAATAAYVGVRLGPGPRDGLLTGIVERSGASVRLVKTGIEGSVVLLGWLLGGTVGWATVAYALLVGVVVQAVARQRWLVPTGLVAAPARRPHRPRRSHRPRRPAAGRTRTNDAVPPSREQVQEARRRRARQIARALEAFGDQDRTL